MPIKTLAEARRVLEQFYDSSRPKGQAYSLEHMHELLAILGNPQNTLRVIHVAGTSGKTSTAYYAAALLHAAGHRVGLTVSPHVVDINDRVQIDGVPLDELTFCADLDRFLQLVKRSGLQPNYFEVMMAFAFWEFAAQQVNYALVEVGFGGLLDMSNVIERSDKVCIITDIGFDHMHILGKTLPEIARQKAGIIQHRNAVFCFRQSAEIMTEIQQRCRQQQADLQILANNELLPVTHNLPLFQQRNFSLAYKAAQYVLSRDNQQLSEANQKQAAAIIIPGRMEVVQIGDKTVILDGAHNEQKLTALMTSVVAQYPGQGIAVLVAFVEKPEALERTEACLRIMQPVVSEMIVTEFGGPQDAPYISLSAEIVAALAKTVGLTNIQVHNDPQQAFGQLLSASSPIIVVTGSFYLLNHIRSVALEMR